MWIGNITVKMSELIDLFKQLDSLAPGWQIPNEVTETTRAMLINRAINDSDYDYTLWVGIVDPNEAMITRLSVIFDEFGEAVWDDQRQFVSTNWFYRPRNHTQAGWVIK